MDSLIKCQFSSGFFSCLSVTFKHQNILHSLPPGHGIFIIITQREIWRERQETCSLRTQHVHVIIRTDIDDCIKEQNGIGKHGMEWHEMK